jgi:FtsH-binding integral membrane protein|tara:strand:+ start:55 stop:504 length:450 start_codon:yes stop_codon:yes gene_type:complete
MRKRKERRRAEQASKNSPSKINEAKPTEPEKISDKTNYSQETQKLETPKTSNSILSQIPRYVYLIAIFVLLSGVFFPLITTGADDAFSFVIGGTAILFLGLAGGILLFKATTSDKKRGILFAIGFALIAMSLALIFMIQEWWKLEFYQL